MLRSESLFGKRTPPTPSTTGSSVVNSMTSTGSQNIQRSPNAVTPTATGAPTPNTHVDVSTNEVGSKLIVGPNIKLKGVEITDCDTLVVEGRVEATMDSRVIQIAENGSFKGSAEIDIAEIRGEFNGDLTARVKLVIYATGKVNGKIRYGKIVIEEGGQLIGDVQVGSTMAPSAISTVKESGTAVSP